MAKGHTHVAPIHQTEVLLEQLVDRVACQSSGPRLIAGDLNHTADELLQLQRLQSMGWREAQDYAASQRGQCPQATGRGTIRLD